MASGERMRICLIGAGNVGTHLGIALSAVADVVQVVSRHMESAMRLADRIGGGCMATDRLSSLCDDADLYLLAVNDDCIGGIAGETPDYPGIWAHTSGSVPADIFAGLKSNYGVFYPLQTFTRDVNVDVCEVPFFIEGSDARTERALAELARGISRRVEFADSARRGQLHVAAVFACNFANLMWMEADKLLKPAGLDVTYMMPLLKATLGKLGSVSPRDAMTGPARRGDREVMEAHLAKLSGRDKEMYRLLSEAIIEEFYGSDEQDKL